MDVKIDNLKRHFGGTKAVDGISFSFSSGNIFGFVGPNGAGKTTTMRILATLDLPDAGTVLVNGVDIVEEPGRVRGNLGWMPDHFTPYKDVVVGDYLDFFGRAHGFHGAELAGRVAEVMDFTELTPLANRLSDQLCKGQTQRLCLARTLLNDPDFLLLDEPAAGLDPKARLEFKNLVRILRERGKTLLISSHILSELGEMCDTLVFMDAGQVMHHGDTGSLQRRASGISGGNALSENDSHHSRERKHEAYASVRLCNKDGDVLWSTTQESLGGKFRGASADVAAKIAHQITLDYQRARRADTPPAPAPKTALQP